MTTQHCALSILDVIYIYSSLCFSLSQLQEANRLSSQETLPSLCKAALSSPHTQDRQNLATITSALPLLSLQLYTAEAKTLLLLCFSSKYLTNLVYHKNKISQTQGNKHFLVL